MTTTTEATRTHDAQPVVYSLVVPVFDEAAVLPALRERLAAVMARLDGPAEVIFVDDGSRDASAELIAGICAEDPRFRAVCFSRNFGHQVAISAGIDHATGDAVIILDADLQDPPEVILELVAKWREGNEIVYAVRRKRDGETVLKRATAAVFYRLLGRLSDVDIPRDAGDFRLVDRVALDAFGGMRERNRYVRGMFAWIGFRQAQVDYVRAPRHAGESKYPLGRMMRLAADGIVGFSSAPLRLILTLGFIVSIGSFALGLGAIGAKIFGLFVVPGWSSLIVAVFFIGGVQLIVLGVIGEYIGRIYDEVKQRPLYVVRRTIGVPDAARTRGAGRGHGPP